MKKLPMYLHTKAKDDGGWSMVEVVTVLVIIFILGAFAAPDIIVWARNSRVTGAAREFVADLNNAKIAAIERNRIVIVDIGNISGGSTTAYTAFVDDGGATGAGTAGNETLDGDEEEIGARNFNTDDYRGAKFTNSSPVTAAKIGFSPRGIPKDNIAREITMTNDDGQIQFRILIANTGAITMLKSKDAGSTWH